MKLIVVAIALTALSGCVAKSMYNWGSYSTSMYQFYEQPEKEQQFTDTLYAIITSNEEAATKVPPGIYAEYGFMLLSAGQSAEAVEYFTKEMTAWPEAEPFMGNMIELANAKNQEKPSAKTGADIGAISADGLKSGG